MGRKESKQTNNQESKTLKERREENKDQESLQSSTTPTGLDKQKFSA